MRKLLVGLLLLTGIGISNAAEARQNVIIVNPVVPVYPVRPCYYRLVPVVQYRMVWTIYGYVYQAYTTYAYQLVCH